MVLFTSIFRYQFFKDRLHSAPENSLYDLRVARYILLILCICLFCSTSYSQCPSAISITSTDVTAADCPSSGSVTVHSDAESVATATYQIVDGPASGGYQTTSQSSNTFSSLPAGNYTIRVTCGSATADVTVNVADNYVNLELSAVVSNECAGNSPGGTITATGSGGKPGLIYGFLKSTNAAEPDANFTYGASNTFTATSFGQYQVRVKDDCNNYTTRTVEIAPLYSSAKLVLSGANFTCASTVYTDNGLYKIGDGVLVDPANSGYKVNIWYSTPADDCNTAPSRVADFSTTVNSQNDINSISIPVAYDAVIIETISPCGEVSVVCQNVLHPDLQVNGLVKVGCGPADDVTIAFNIYKGIAPYNIVIQGYDAANAPVAGTARTINPYDPGTTYSFPTADHYDLVVTDACGTTINKTYVTPKPADGTNANNYEANTRCVNLVGGLNITAYMEGYIPGVADADFELVTTGGAHVANGFNYDPNNNSISFNPVLPGDYLIRVKSKPTSNCPSIVTDIPFHVGSPYVGLIFDLDGTASQLCGGTGSITTILDFNGLQPVSYQLIQGGSVIATNTTGTFTNLASGDYTVKAIDDLSSCGLANLETSKNFTIQPAGSAPVVLKKLGISCDNDPATGRAIFEFSGFGPFLVEMKKTTETNYDVKGTDVPNTYTVSPLETGFDYDVRITDKCGTTTVTQVSIKPLTNVATTTTDQPCVEKPYTLAMEDIPTATYSWTFNGGPVISTAKDLIFANYTSANDGQYVCTVKIGDCVTRTTTINVSSTKCGNPLPVTLSLFGAKKESQTALLTWATTMESNADHFEIQRSFNGKTWKVLGTVAAKGNSIEIEKYSFVDPTPVNGENLYRLRLVDKDYIYSFSHIESLKFELLLTASVFPNPVSDVVFVKDLKVDARDIKNVSVINSNGKVMRSISSIPATGISVKDLPSGTYVLQIKETDNTVHTFKVVISR